MKVEGGDRLYILDQRLYRCIFVLVFFFGLASLCLMAGFFVSEIDAQTGKRLPYFCELSVLFMLH